MTDTENPQRPDDAEREKLEEKLAGTFSRLGKALGLLHSSVPGEQEAALRVCLNNFDLINRLSKVLNPDSPLVLSFPELLRLADIGGNAKLLAKLEELFQANAALKASEELLLRDRRRLEILLQHAGKGDQKFLAEQRKALQEIIEGAQKTIETIPVQMADVVSRLDGAMAIQAQTAQTAPEIPEVYRAWINAVEQTHVPLEAVLEGQTLPWWKRKLLQSSGLPTTAGEIEVMRLMIQAQGRALRQRPEQSTGLSSIAAQLTHVLGEMASFQSALAQAGQQFSPTHEDLTPDQEELLAHLSDLQRKSFEQEEVLRKAVEEKEAHATERDRLLKQLRKHRLTHKRRAAMAHALRYREASHDRGRQLEGVRNLLEGVFTPEAMNQLLSGSSLGERERADMATVMKQTLSAADLSHLVLRGFMLGALEERLQGVVSQQKLSKEEVKALRDLAEMFVQCDSSSDRFFSVIIPLGFSSMASLFALIPAGAFGHSNSFLVFAGASILSGAMASGIYHAVRTFFVCEEMPARFTKKVRAGQLAGKSFTNGLLPGALTGIFAGMALTAVTEPNDSPPSPHEKKAAAPSAPAVPLPAASANPSSPGSPAQQNTTVLIVPAEFAEAARKAAELCAAQSSTGKKITCVSVGTGGAAMAPK